MMLRPKKSPHYKKTSLDIRYSNQYSTVNDFSFKGLISSITMVILISYGVTSLKSDFKRYPIETGYISNATIITAQQNAKKSSSLGEMPANGIDEYMREAPDLERKKGYRFKSPNGHAAYYFENETGEPFLVDDSNNLWIWAGIDVENPNDDWLVRTPEGNVFNFFVDGSGQLQLNLIGNEKDLKVASNTNLGTIVGFISDEITDLHYMEVPPSSLQYYALNDQDRIAIPPTLLEEGFLEFKDTHALRRKEHTSLTYNESKESEHVSERFIEKEQDPFMEYMSRKSGTSSQKNDRLMNRNTNKKNAIKDVDQNMALVTMLKGIDVKNLPKALDYISTQ